MGLFFAARWYIDVGAAADMSCRDWGQLGAGEQFVAPM
jgi:hypothetical protein